MQLSKNHKLNEAGQPSLLKNSYSSFYFFFVFAKKVSKPVANNFPSNNYSISDSSKHIRSCFENLLSQKTKTNFLVQQVNLTHPEGFQNCQNFQTVPSAREDEESMKKGKKRKRERARKRNNSRKK